jgi:hypothetical protein
MGGECYGVTKCISTGSFIFATCECKIIFFRNPYPWGAVFGHECKTTKTPIRPLR